MALHLGFLLYLHFGYHKVVEGNNDLNFYIVLQELFLEINEMFGNELIEQQRPAPVLPAATLPQELPSLQMAEKDAGPSIHHPAMARSPLNRGMTLPPPSAAVPGLNEGTPFTH